MEDLDENSNLGHLDLYTDLLADDVVREQESLDELREKYDSAQQKIITLETELHQSRQNESKLKETLDTVQKNMAALLVTARSELQRKTQEINDLRKNVERKIWNRRQTILNAKADDISDDIYKFQQRRKYCYRQYSDDEIKEGHARQNGHTHSDNKISIHSSPMATQQKVNPNSPGTSLKRRLDSDEENEKQSKRNKMDRKDYKNKSLDNDNRKDKSEHSGKKTTDKVVHGNKTPCKSNSKQDMARELLEKSKKKLRRTSKETSSRLCSENTEIESRKERSKKDVFERKTLMDDSKSDRKSAHNKEIMSDVEKRNNDLGKKNLSTALTDKENMFVSESSGYLSVEKEKSKSERTITEDPSRDSSGKSRHRDRKSKRDKELKLRQNKEETRSVDSPYSDRHFRSRSRDRSLSISPKKKRSRQSSNSPISPRKYERESSRSSSSQRQCSNSPEKKFNSPKSVVMDLREKLRASKQCEKQIDKEKRKIDTCQNSVDQELSMQKQQSKEKEEKLISPSESPVKYKHLERQRHKVKISEEKRFEIDRKTLCMNQVNDSRDDKSVGKELEGDENRVTRNKNVMDGTLSGDHIPPWDSLNTSLVGDTASSEKAAINVADTYDKKLSSSEEAMLFKEFIEIQEDALSKPCSISDKLNFLDDLNDSTVSDVDTICVNRDSNNTYNKGNAHDIDVTEIGKKCESLQEKVKMSKHVIGKSEKAKKSEDGISHEIVEKEMDTRDDIDEDETKLLQRELCKDSDMVKNLKDETTRDVKTVNIHSPNHAERYLGVPIKKSSKKKKNKTLKHNHRRSNSKGQMLPEKMTESLLENLNTSFTHEIVNNGTVEKHAHAVMKNDGNEEKFLSDTGESFDKDQIGDNRVGNIEDIYSSCKQVSKDINNVDPDKCGNIDIIEGNSDSEENDHFKSYDFKENIDHFENATLSPVKQNKRKSLFEEEDKNLTNDDTINDIKSDLAVPLVESVMSNKNSGDLYKSPGSCISEPEIQTRENLTYDSDDMANDNADSTNYESQHTSKHDNTVTQDDNELSDENEISCEEGEITPSEDSCHLSELDVKLPVDSGGYEFSIHLTETEHQEFQYESPCKKTPVKDKQGTKLPNKSDKNRSLTKSKQQEKDTNLSRRKLLSRSRTRSRSCEKEKYEKLSEKNRKDLSTSKRRQSKSPKYFSSRSRSLEKEKGLSSRKSDRSHKSYRDRPRHDKDKKEVERYSTHAIEQRDRDKRDKEKSSERSSRERSERHHRDTKDKHERYSRDSRERDDKSAGRIKRKEIECSKSKTRAGDHDRKSREVKGNIKDRLGSIKKENEHQKREVDRKYTPDKNSFNISNRILDESEQLSVQKNDLNSQTGLNSENRSVVSYSDIDLSSISEEKYDEHEMKKTKADGVDVFVKALSGVDKISNVHSVVSYSDIDKITLSEEKNSTEQVRDSPDNVDEVHGYMLSTDEDTEKSNVNVEELSEKQNDGEITTDQDANMKIKKWKNSREEDNLFNSDLRGTRLQDDLVLSSDYGSDSESEGNADVLKDDNNLSDMCEKSRLSKTSLDNVNEQNMPSEESKGTRNKMNRSSKSVLDNVDEQNLPTNETKFRTKMLNEKICEENSGLVTEEKIMNKMNMKTSTKGEKFDMYNDVGDAVLDLFLSSPVSSIECVSPMKQRLQQFVGENVHKSEILSEIESNNLTPKSGKICVSDSSDIDKDEENELELTFCNDTKIYDSSVKETGTNGPWKETWKKGSKNDISSENDVSSSEHEIEKLPNLEMKSRDLNIQSTLVISENEDNNLVGIIPSSSLKVVDKRLNQEVGKNGQVDTSPTNVIEDAVSSNSDFNTEAKMKTKYEDKINKETCCDYDDIQMETSVIPESEDSQAISLEDGEITESDEDGDDKSDIMVTDSLDDIDLKELINLRKKLLAESIFDESEKEDTKKIKSDREKHSSNRQNKKRHNSDESRKRHQSGSLRLDSPRSMDRTRLELNEGLRKRDVHKSSPRGSDSSRKVLDKKHRSEIDESWVKMSKEKLHKSDSHRKRTSSKTSERTRTSEKSKHSSVLEREKTLSRDSNLATKEQDVRKHDAISRSGRDKTGSTSKEEISKQTKEAKRSEGDNGKVCKSDMNMYHVSKLVSVVPESRTGESKSRHLERDNGHSRNRGDKDSREIMKGSKCKSKSENNDLTCRKMEGDIRYDSEKKTAAGRSSETLKLTSEKHAEETSKKRVFDDKITKHSVIKTKHKSVTPERCKNKTEDDKIS